MHLESAGSNPARDKTKLPYSNKEHNKMPHFRRQPLSLDHYLYLFFQPETLESRDGSNGLSYRLQGRPEVDYPHKKIKDFILCFTRLLNIYQDK